MSEPVAAPALVQEFSSAALNGDFFFLDRNLIIEFLPSSLSRRVQEAGREMSEPPIPRLPPEALELLDDPQLADLRPRAANLPLERL